MILYTLTNCPGCRTVKAALARNPAVRVEERNCDIRANAQELNRLGATTAPVLVRDGKIVASGPGAILQALGIR